MIVSTFRANRLKVSWKTRVKGSKASTLFSVLENVMWHASEEKKEPAKFCIAIQWQIVSVCLGLQPEAFRHTSSFQKVNSLKNVLIVSRTLWEWLRIFQLIKGDILTKMHFSIEEIMTRDLNIVYKISSFHFEGKAQQMY